MLKERSPGTASVRRREWRRAAGRRCKAVVLLGSALGLAACAAGADSTHQARLADPTREAAPALAELRLSLALVRGSGWNPGEVERAAAQAAGLLAQCGIRTEAIEVHELDVEPRFRVLWTPASRELAHRAKLSRPTVFFVAETRHRPAFDAEAIGRANSRSRPEMADTVWIVAGSRDLPIVLAHELAHVLADSGEHSDEPGNLMREETSPSNVRLDDRQCRSIVRAGVRNGLLRQK